MNKKYAFLILILFSIMVSAQDIEKETSELKELELRLISLKNLHSQLDGIFKDKTEKKNLEKNIKETNKKIINKKLSLYEARVKLPANDPRAILIKIDNIERQNTINTYDELIKNLLAEIHKLPKDASGKYNNKDQSSYDDFVKVKEKYTKEREKLQTQINLEKVKIFEQAELIQKEELPFELTPEERLNTSNDPLIAQKIDVNKKLERLRVNEKSKKAFANTKATYKATIYNTNFTVPVARFNFGDDENSEGDVILFNSIGAGFGKSWGKLEEIRNGAGDLVATDFRNSISIHAGVLFSASSGEDGNNVFAPVISLGLLDFQLGLGYELGTLANSQDPFFLTIGYAIPLYKLTKTKFYVKRKSKILNEITAF
ncbi:hypothetical protein Q4Q39_15640 [Flavivirga amylovorans]|uniref:Uncharacterized protein n=1 Tax=Flavivirga amylovorans TaxID=870486 RepID=A0ABT8X4E8_9FLAO|nr:hypothetical protein [Flavivirga amylovorans]MDO5988843.1 hypothetical protein [Flavivirga amylovorans]